MAKIPSPCVDVCKYKRQGHCIACSMTKAQKSLFKELKKSKHQQAYIDMLVLQQERLGKFEHWSEAYAKKCRKKGTKNPLAKV